MLCTYGGRGRAIDLVPLPLCVSPASSISIHKVLSQRAKKQKKKLQLGDGGTLQRT